MTRPLNKESLNSIFEGFIEHSPWRGFPAISSSEHKNIFYNEITRAHSNGTVTLDSSIDPQLAFASQQLDWDTNHFGMPMGRIQFYHCQDMQLTKAKVFIGKALDELDKHSPIRHYVTEVDSNDYLSLNALVANGFEILDTKKIYCFKKHQPDTNPKFSSMVRPYRKEDYQRVMQIVESTNFPSRFTRDPYLNPHKCRDLKTLWFSNLLKESSRNLAFVFERPGVIESCGAISSIDENTLGIPKKILYGGLFASTKKGTGSYLPVMKKLVTHGMASHDCGATVVSINNSAPQRVIDSCFSFNSPLYRHVLRRYYEKNF